jgi:hypothetical protein
MEIYICVYIMYSHRHIYIYEYEHIWQYVFIYVCMHVCMYSHLWKFQTYLFKFYFHFLTIFSFFLQDDDEIMVDGERQPLESDDY